MAAAGAGGRSWPGRLRSRASEKRHDPDDVALAEDVGAPWLLTAEPMDFDDVRAGPPR
jgi:hypothetical protein